MINRADIRAWQAQRHRRPVSDIELLTLMLRCSSIKQPLAAAPNPELLQFKVDSWVEREHALAAYTKEISGEDLMHLSPLRLLQLAVFVFSTAPTVAQAEFIGDLSLEPKGCEKTERCTLGADFGYIDARRIGWKADKGDVTDGASIPRWAQKFVGIPFEPAALPAAVLHDHYSKSVRPVRGWFQTQRMFYQALRDSGVDEPRASMMYAGVLIGSGKWITRIKGQPCNLGPGIPCTNQQTVDITLERLPETYGNDDYKALLASIQSQIESGAVGQEAVEALVRAKLPSDIYLHSPSGQIVDNVEVGIWATDK